MKEIHWGFYRLRQDERGKINSLIPDDGDIEYHINAAEQVLLEQGHHVILGEEDKNIWTFCLSETENEDCLHTLSNHDVECMCILS